MNGKRLIYTILRFALGVLFLFSGFAKAIDPWGTAIKFGEYFAAMGLNSPEWSKFALSILLSGLEMGLGISVLLGACMKLSSFGLLCFMLIFTPLTLWAAVAEPVEDCGCFGDLLKISNWATFGKNLVLLLMAAMLFILAECAKRSSWLNWLKFCGSFVISFGIGLYSLLHLPLIDVLSYKVGTSLVEAVRTGITFDGDIETTLIYRNLYTGENKEFKLSDPEWQDAARWEYVDTRIVQKGTVKHHADFSVFGTEGNITEDILSSPRRVYLLCLASPTDINESCRTRMAGLARQAVGNGNMVLGITSSLISDRDLYLNDMLIPLYNMDATALKTMLRAKYGVVVIENGTIIEKRNCRDIRIGN